MVVNFRSPTHFMGGSVRGFFLSSPSKIIWSLSKPSSWCGEWCGLKLLDEYVIFIQQQQLNAAIKTNCCPLRQKVACVSHFLQNSCHGSPSNCCLKFITCTCTRTASATPCACPVLLQTLIFEAIGAGQGMRVSAFASTREFKIRVQWIVEEEWCATEGTCYQNFRWEVHWKGCIVREN
jgi:hypothetical protein